MDDTKFFEKFNIQKDAWLEFEISDDHKFDLESIIEVFCKIIDKLDLTYNYEYAIFDKSYWKKGWYKHDQLFKHVGKLSDISKEELMKIKDECNGFFWEAKYKRKLVIHISFFLTDMNNYQNLKNHYSIMITEKGEIYDRELIMELAKIVKEGIKAKDEIIIGKDPKLLINDEAITQVEFSKF